MLKNRVASISLSEIEETSLSDISMQRQQRIVEHLSKQLQSCPMQLTFPCIRISFGKIRAASIEDGSTQELALSMSILKAIRTQSIQHMQVTCLHASPPDLPDKQLFAGSDVSML